MDAIRASSEVYNTLITVIWRFGVWNAYTPTTTSALISKLHETIVFFSSRLQPLEPLELEIQDESGGEESKFMISVVSKSFEGLPLLKRHRSVYGLIADEMKIVHAVTLSTNTPEEVGM